MAEAGRGGEGGDSGDGSSSGLRVVIAIVPNDATKIGPSLPACGW